MPDHPKALLLCMINTYYFLPLSVPVGVAENVRAFPYNSTAIVVNWKAVPNTREAIKGVLIGYRVGEVTHEGTLDLSRTCSVHIDVCICGYITDMFCTCAHSCMYMHTHAHMHAYIQTHTNTKTLL